MARYCSKVQLKVIILLMALFEPIVASPLFGIGNGRAEDENKDKEDDG